MQPYFRKDLTSGEYYQYMRELYIARVKVFMGGLVIGSIASGLIVYFIMANVIINTLL